MIAETLKNEKTQVCGKLHQDYYYDVPCREDGKVHKEVFLLGHYVGTSFRLDKKFNNHVDAMLACLNCQKKNDGVYQVLRYEVTLENIYQQPLKLNV